MAFDVAGLYRCATCRSKTDPIPESWLKAKEEMAPAVARLKHLTDEPVQPITGRHIELDQVAPGQRVIAEGGNASILVHGDVADKARLTAQGRRARIVIKGRVGAYVTVTAQGGQAQVRYGSADPTARITAQGGGSAVKATGRARRN